MRTSLITLLAMTAATGCATSADYAHTAEFYVQARGVAYTDDASAQVGMYGVTCAINPSTGMIEEDVDIEDEDDDVKDSFDGDALIADSDSFTVYRPSGGFGMGNLDSVPVPGLQDVGFSADGIVSLAADGCAVDFHGLDVQVSLGEVCDTATLASHGSQARVAVLDGTTAHLVGSDGSVIALGAASDIAMGDSTVYTASNDVVSAFDLDGTPLWSRSFDSTITDLTNMVDAAAVMMDTRQGYGEFLTLDSLTGEETSQMLTPTAARQVVVSQSGDELAMVLDEAIHFFNVQ